MTTLKAARAVLAEQITTAGLSDVTVYGFEPPVITGGVAVTVASNGFTATEWNLDVRVYVSAVSFSPEAAQDALDDTAPAVDGALESVPRGDWQFGFDQEMNAFVGAVTVQYPRDDF